MTYAANIEKRREKNRRYYQENIEKQRERARARAKFLHETGTRKRDNVKEREYCKKWKAKNRERIAEYNAIHVPEWHKKNPNWWSEYYSKNKEEVKARAATQQARRKGASGTYTVADVNKLFEAQCGLCAFYAACGNKITKSGPEKYQVDHIEPLCPKDKSRSPGTNDPSNLQLTCAACNSKKRAKDPYVFTQAHEGRLFPDLPRDPKKR